jgi:hypothetical protein
VGLGAGLREVGGRRLIGPHNRHRSRLPMNPEGRGRVRRPLPARSERCPHCGLSDLLLQLSAIGSNVDDGDLASTFRGVVRLLVDTSIRETAVGVYCVPALDRNPASADPLATSARVRSRPLTEYRRSFLASAIN